MNQKPVSSCHNAPVKVVGGDEGTNHYECTECGKPCDPANQKPVDDKELDELLMPFIEARWMVDDAGNNPSEYKLKKWLKEDLEELKATLNAHFQKKYIGLLMSLFPEYDQITNPNYSFIINKHRLDEALANIKSEGGE